MQELHAAGAGAQLVVMASSSAACVHTSTLDLTNALSCAGLLPPSLEPCRTRSMPFGRSPKRSWRTEKQRCATRIGRQRKQRTCTSESSRWERQSAATGTAGKAGKKNSQSVTWPAAAGLAGAAEPCRDWPLAAGLARSVC